MTSSWRARFWSASTQLPRRQAPSRTRQATPSSARQRPWAKATGDEPDDWDLSGDTFDSVEDAKAYFDKAAGRA